MPDVIHCHDWQSALVPVLLRTQYEKDATVEGLAVEKGQWSCHGFLPMFFVGKETISPQSGIKRADDSGTTGDGLTRRPRSKTFRSRPN